MLNILFPRLNIISKLLVSRASNVYNFSNGQDYTRDYEQRERFDQSRGPPKYNDKFKPDLDSPSMQNFIDRRLQMKEERNRFYRNVDIPPPSGKLDDIVKNVYKEFSVVQKMSQQEVNTYREKNKVTCTGNRILNPALSFSYMGLKTEICQNLNLEFQKPTPIQCQAIPFALSGMNLVCVSETGSGKTLAYLLPALEHLIAQPTYSSRNATPKVLFLSPTRELAIQIFAFCTKYCPFYRVFPAIFYGGKGQGFQQKFLSNPIDICVATPGRLIDLMQSGNITLEQVTYCVLDEADMMLDIGFEIQIRKILGQTRIDKQMMYLSATWNHSVRRLVRDFSPAYAQINVGATGLKAKSSIKQTIIFCNRQNKIEILLDLIQNLSKDGFKKSLLFAATQKRVGTLNRIFRKRKYPSEEIHGGLTQRKREMSLQRFRDGKISFLIATDVASRGLDIKDVDYVINIDFPSTLVGYVHRIGRTARAEKSGNSFTLFCEPDDDQFAYGLANILKDCDQKIDPKLEEIAKMA